MATGIEYVQIKQNKTRRGQTGATHPTVLAVFSSAPRAKASIEKGKM